jgi:adenosine deaminase
MRFSRFFVLIFCAVHSTCALSNVENYFSSIKNNPEALYSFFKTMPKGGELHYHLAGGAPPEAMLSLAPQGNYCLDKSTYAIQARQDIPKHQPCHGVLLNNLKKHSPLYENILRAWSLKDFTSQQESKHDHFFASFFKFSPIVSAFGAELLTEVMKRAAKQHELYLEVMVLPDDAHASQYGTLVQHTKNFKEKQNILLANPLMQNNIHDTITKSNALINKAKDNLHCNEDTKNPACDLTVRLQYIILREQPINAFFAQALNGFAATSKSDTLVSINLVQAEDGPLSLQNYRQQMKIISFLHKEYPMVHIALHAGELRAGKLGETEVNPKELSYHIHDALLIGKAERIGHGTDINSEKNAELLLKRMSEKKIPVEINLTSSQQLLNVASQHPIHHYLEHHVPVILGTDDEGILRTNLTHEYVKASTEQKLDYAILKTINRNTLTFSFLAGKSLWQDPAKNIPVAACENLHSSPCLEFIAHSPKAKLQWRLEVKLAAFEKQFQKKHRV